jgi:hypothetical protein
MVPINAVIPLPQAEHSLDEGGQATKPLSSRALNDLVGIDLGFKVSLSNDCCKSPLRLELATEMRIPDHALQSRLRVLSYQVQYSIDGERWVASLRTGD